MPTINRKQQGTFAVSSDIAEIKKIVKPRKATKKVVSPEQSKVSYTKLPTKRLVKTVSMEKLSKKRK